MTSALWLLMQSVIVLLVLVVAVSLACRLLRNRPAAQHAMWLIVMLTFLMPPVAVWPWSVSHMGDRVARWISSRNMDVAEDTEGTLLIVDQSPREHLPPQPRIPIESNGNGPGLSRDGDDDLSSRSAMDADVGAETTGAFLKTYMGRSVEQYRAIALVALWLGGCIVMLGILVRRIVQQAAIVRCAESAPKSLTDQTAIVADRLNMNVLPVIVTRKTAMPFVWCLGRLRIVWPESMTGSHQLSRSSGIIAHELAHVSRRDHWVAWLEMVAAVVWWWNPLFWFVRRRLRESADLACDAVALSVYEDRREYAEMFLEVSSNYRSGAPAPVLGVNNGPSSSFEKRLAMILDDRVAGRLSVRAALLVGCLAAVVLPTLPQAQMPFMCLGIAAGAAASEVSSPPPTKPVKGHRWGDPYDWVNDPPAVIDLDFSALRFKQPALRSTVVRWSDAASRMHEKEWFHHDWYTRPPGHSAIAWWSLTPEHIHPSGNIEGAPQSKPGLLHHIRIGVASNTSVYEPEFATLRAIWMPAGNNWGGYLDISTSGDAEGDTMLRFQPRAGLKNAPQLFSFYPGLARWEHRTTFDEVNYLFRVALPESPFDGNDASAPLDFHRLAQWSESAESFQDAGLEMLSQLEQLIREQLPSGEAINSVSVTVVHGGKRSDDPPRYFEEPVDRPLTTNELERVMDAALQEVAGRRRILKRHATAMHAALKNVFPVKQLGAPQQPEVKDGLQQDDATVQSRRKAHLQEFERLTPQAKKEAITAIRQLGGSVVFDETNPDKPVISVNLSGTPVTDAGLRHLPAFSNLRKLNLSNTNITDKGLVHLKSLTDLQALNLGHNNLTDSGISELTGLTNLQQLALDYTDISDDGLSHLKALTNLQYLRVNSTNIGDAGLAHLQGHTSLRNLDLSFTKVSDDGLANLRGLANLEQLDLAKTHVGNTDLAPLKKATKLKVLDVRATSVTDAGLKALEDSRNLESLDLGYTKVGDDGLAHLKSLTNLRKLTLHATEVSDAGLLHIKGLTELTWLELSGTKVTDGGLVHMSVLPKVTDLYLMNTNISNTGLVHLKKMTSLRDLYIEATSINAAGARELGTALSKCVVHH